MNIKSLLLGSAAALVAVSGARAADVIVPAAAEPAEYVKVCDVYGEGFYYIPGTETCLQISGYVRFKVYAQDNSVNTEGDDYSSTTETRVRLNFDVREETELGTLRAFARVQATNGGSFTDQPYSMDLGYIQLGGLTMGYLDTLWTEGDGLLTDTDLPVGDIQVNRISYNYAAGAFSLAGSLEDDNSGDITPNFVARVAYDGGMFGAYLAGSIDSDNDRSIYDNGFFGGDLFVDPEGDTDTAFAIKGGVSIKPVENGELKIEASYAFDPSRYSTLDLFNAPSVSTVSFGGSTFVIDPAGSSLPVEWQAGAGYAQTFGKLGVAVAGVYGETFDAFGVDGGVVRNFGSGEYYKFVGNVGYEITNNFDVLGEISYANVDLDEASFDQTAGFIQFVRSF